MKDFKRRLSQGSKIEKDTHRLIDGLVFPDALIRSGGHNPDDFPKCDPPSMIDLQNSIQRLKDIEETAKIELHKIAMERKEPKA